MKLSVLSLWTGQRGTDVASLPDGVVRNSVPTARPVRPASVDFHAPESAPASTAKVHPAKARPGRATAVQI